ncbi:MAG: hypothetical protein H0Z39_06850 [Peptococcaceae bacterium]|nr:hypothetical protein [Peptococcaceae bacterium]
MRRFTTIEQLCHKIDELEQENQALNQEINQLTDTIEALSQMIQEQPKKDWTETLNKIANGAKITGEVITLLASTFLTIMDSLSKTHSNQPTVPAGFAQGTNLNSTKIAELLQSLASLIPQPEQSPEKATDITAKKNQEEYGGEHQEPEEADMDNEKKPDTGGAENKDGQDPEE